jgi:hypothetical protein
MKRDSRSSSGVLLVVAFAAIAVSCSVAQDPTQSIPPTGEPSISTVSPQPTDAAVPARWWVDGDTLPLEPEATLIEGFIRERSCAGGQSPVGRVAKPSIDYRPDAVIVTFVVLALACEHDCGGNPAFPVVVTLAEPLGARSLLDGSEDPPRDATTPPTF